MYLKIFIIFIVVLILLSVYLNLNKEENTFTKEITKVSNNPVSEESTTIDNTQPQTNTQNDELPDYNTKIYGKKVNYIGGPDVYSSLPVSMDKTGYYAYEEGCKSCKKYALGWRCKAHKYNNTKDVSLKPEGMRDLCKNYTNFTPLMYDGVRKIDNRIMA